MISIWFDGKENKLGQLLVKFALGSDFRVKMQHSACCLE